VDAGYSEVFHAGANIEVCLGGVALRGIGADCGVRGARVSLFTGSRDTNVASRGENVLEMIRLDHAAFAPDHMLSDRPTKTAGAKLAYR